MSAFSWSGKRVLVTGGAGFFGSFVVEVPAPLAIGTVTLDDGTDVKGFVAESYACADATDISRFGGWRAYLASQQTQQAQQ